MYGQKRTGETSAQKIRRPKAEAPPTLADLKGLQEESDQNRNREIEQMWTSPSGATYCLNIKTAPGPVEPMWICWKDEGNGTHMVWQYQTIDTDLINDCVSMLEMAVATPIGAPTQPVAPPPPPEPASPTAGTPVFGQSQPSASPYAIPANPYGTPQSTSPPSGKIFGSDDDFPKPMPRESTGFSSQNRTDGPGASAMAKPKDELSGSLDDVKVPALLKSMTNSKLTGKLEILGEESVGSVFFVEGTAKHATTPSAHGDGAIRELVTWEKGTYQFHPNARTDMRSVEGQLDALISDGQTMLDQKRHLKRAGLSFESLLLRKHKQLSEGELKLMLMRGAEIDFEFQKRIYEYLRFKRTFTDLLRDHPMNSTTWTALLFNFISCGLIEIKEPDSVRSDVLDFLGADKDHVHSFEKSFIRPETGIYSYEALLFFLEYEFHRFEAYNYPLSLILFEINHKKPTGGTDMLTGQAMNTASQRINLIKRKLDTLGHFQTLEYALILPNTKGSSAAWVANKMYESITATPIGKDLDRNTLQLAFGVASLPADGDSLQMLITCAKNAKTEAKGGTFPVVVSRGAKK